MRRWVVTSCAPVDPLQADGASVLAVSQCTSVGVVQIPLKAFEDEEAELVAAHDPSGPIGHRHRALQPDWVDVIDSQHGTSPPVVCPSHVNGHPLAHLPQHLARRDRAIIPRGRAVSAALGVQLDLSDIERHWREIFTARRGHQTPQNSSTSVTQRLFLHSD